MKRIAFILSFLFISSFISRAQGNDVEDVFFTQLKTVFEAQKTQFGEYIGKSIKKTEDEETFECTLKLEGFSTNIIKDEFGDMHFVAKSNRYALAETNVKRLLNMEIRESEGIVGFINIDDKKANPNLYNECMVATSLYNNTLKSLNIHICERPSHLGFIIKIN